MLTIREAAQEDLPALLAIYNYAIVHTTATFDLEEQTLEEREEWFSHYGGVHPLIVAELDGQVAGYGSLSPFRSKPAYARTVENSVYIDPAFFGQGIGARLLEELLVRARALGHHAVLAGITGGNTASIRLHEKFGFRHVGTFPEVGFKFGAWQDVSFYQLVLGDS
ncbi:N-acetyltransferase [Paenibacillus sp. J31TS4]|uniref:GNAT family N-acetyltransferase n=1 Tax=Paenibacillus sp. J31TS4 TaxID=2807195 RepID=UPI001B0B5A9A|nr:GNAT family N-acetyltransferase [Paenibacillus sp. J31TS4]GIP39005.1 N-acetyltransferase [Paenibacillus sp. J31TS4]